MKLSNELIKFNNHSKQVAVSLKIYGNFQSVLTIRVQKINKDDNVSYTEKYQEHIFCNFTHKIVCINDRFNKPVVLYRGKMQSIDLLQHFLMSMSIVDQLSKSTFKKILS